MKKKLYMFITITMVNIINISTSDDKNIMQEEIKKIQEIVEKRMQPSLHNNDHRPNHTNLVEEVQQMSQKAPTITNMNDAKEPTAQPVDKIITPPSCWQKLCQNFRYLLCCCNCCECCCPDEE